MGQGDVAGVALDDVAALRAEDERVEPATVQQQDHLAAVVERRDHLLPERLAQGAEGIAVGLSTKVLPHNFNELIDASIKILRNKPFTLYPDFPTQGIADVSNYNDGMRGGRVRVRAKISQLDKNTLVITQIPFSTNTSSLIDSILKANDKGKIKIKKIEDNTAAEVEILIHLFPGVSPDKTIDALFAFTACETSVAPLGCVIEDHKPRFVGVSEMLRVSTHRTVELLKQIPGVKAAMFASLPPGAKLVRHRDPYAGSLRYHLGLTTPNDPGCYIEVDGQRYHWKDGEDVMFDETFIHYAENTTTHQRVILFCDVERPVHFAAIRWLNRAFGKLVMTSAATQNLESEPIGGLNKFFYHAYKVRLFFKAFKARSRLGYYVVKWALILGILAAIFL